MKKDKLCIGGLKAEKEKEIERMEEGLYKRAGKRRLYERKIGDRSLN